MKEKIEKEGKTRRGQERCEENIRERRKEAEKRKREEKSGVEQRRENQCSSVGNGEEKWRRDDVSLLKESSLEGPH